MNADAAAPERRQVRGEGRRAAGEVAYAAAGRVSSSATVETNAGAARMLEAERARRARRAKR